MLRLFYRGRGPGVGIASETANDGTQSVLAKLAGAERSGGEGPRDRIKDNCLAAKERKKEVGWSEGKRGEDAGTGWTISELGRS